MAWQLWAIEQLTGHTHLIFTHISEGQAQQAAHRVKFVSHGSEMIPVANIHHFKIIED